MEGSRPLVAAGIVVFLLLGGLALPTRAEGGASFGPQMRTATFDTNGNGLYDVLQVIVDLVVTVPGSYTVSFQAATPALVFGMDGVSRTFDVGTYPLTFAVSGTVIQAYHLDGPYNVTVQVTQCGGFCPPVAEATYQTAAYRYTQFDPPYAYVSGPITDAGRDTNGDGLYELLVVDVPVTVNQTTELSASVYLSGPGSLAGGHMSGGVARTYAPGTYDLEFTMDGRIFYYYRASGRYSVEGSLTMVGIGWAGAILHTTALYPYDVFARPDGDFAAPPTYETLDTNGNGKADLLRIHVPLRVTAEGDYILQSDLGYGYGMGTNAYRAIHLAPGRTTVDLDYNGIALSHLALNAPWMGSLTVERLGGPLYDANQTMLTTPAYLASDFESRPVSTLQLDVSVPGCSSNCLYSIGTYDPSNGFLAWSAPDALDALPLYNGTFDVLVSTAQGSVVRQVTVSGDTTVGVTVSASPPAAVRQTLDFAVLNETLVSTSETETRDAPYIRFTADLYGNHDGVANATELALTEGFLPGWLHAPSVLLDRQAFPVAWDRLTGVDGEGPVTSTAPVTLHASTDLRFSELPSSAFPKNLTILLPWTPPYFEATYDIALPEGTHAELTTSGAATVARVNVTAWTVTPTAASPGRYPQGGDWVNLEVALQPNPAGGPGGGGPVLPALLLMLLLAVPLACVAAVTAYLLRRNRRRPGGGASPPRMPSGGRGGL